MTAQFEILGHTADLRIWVRANTPEELFRYALKGMAKILSPKAKGQDIRRNFSISSLDLSSLLIDFLNEAIYLANVNKEVYTNVEFSFFEDTHCVGEFIGTKVKEFDEDIKAATYHEAKIEQSKDGFFEVTIIFDI